MKIGIIKLFLPIVFNKSYYSSTSYNIEIINMIKSFEPNSEVDILSSNDILENQKIIYDDNISVFDKHSDIFIDYKKYDKIFVFNSKNNILSNDDRNTCRLYYSEVTKYIKQLKRLKQDSPKTQINYIVTDIPLFDKEIANLSDNILTQSADNSFYNYAFIEKLSIVDEKISKKINKDIKLIYIGNDRDRRDKMLEYFHIDGLQLYGNYKKDDELRDIVENDIHPLEFNQVYDMLNRSKYTIIISDKDYRKYNFLTPRYYEAIMNNCIAFIDNDYDKSYKLLSHDHFRRVKNLEELKEKINYLENNEDYYLKILEEQQEEFYFLSKNIKNQFRDLLKKLK